MKTIEISGETGSLADYARDVGGDPAILTVDGRPVAALIPLENVDVETARLSMHPQFIDLIERSRARHASEGGISSAEMRQRLQTSRRRGE